MNNASDTITVIPYYYGSKRGWATEVWQRFGHVPLYVEPFCGSASLALNCPYEIEDIILYDNSGLVCNLLRAVKANPEAVVSHAIAPLVHDDVVATCKWLRKWEEDESWRLAEGSQVL